MGKEDGHFTADGNMGKWEYGKKRPEPEERT
jgi:hypothetical protein